MATNGTNGTQNSIRAPNPPVNDSIFKSFRLDGKTVIITGGSGGIGYEVARGLAEAGANIAIWYSISTTAAKQAAKITADFSVKTAVYKVQVENYAEVKQLSQQS